MSKGTPIFSIRLDSDLKSALEQIAQEQGVTLAYVIRLALIAFLSALILHVLEKDISEELRYLEQKQQ